MKKTLNTINELIAPHSMTEVEARGWLIEGGESLDELVDMTNCYLGEIGSAEARSNHYRNTVEV
jgi:hypothetical protein